MLCEVARWKIRSLHGRHIVELTTPMPGQYVRYMTFHAVDTALDRSYAIIKSQLTTHLKAGNCEVARWKIRSLHRRHIVELTTAMGQYVRYTPLHAVDTAQGRSHAIPKSLFITRLMAHGH